MLVFNRFLLLFTLLLSFGVQAYPQFIGYGYNSCTTCHHNPFGGGPLNNYGRALSATAISARWLKPDYMTEEQITESAGFFYNRPDDSWLSPSADYRGLFLQRGIGSSNKKSDWINMTADLSLVMKFGKRDQYISSATVSYVPEPLGASGPQAQEHESYRWREAFVGYRPTSELGIYVGLLDKVFGVRLAEHTSFSRAINNLAQNDQSFGGQLHYSISNFEFGAGYFIGNLNQDKDLRQVGFSFKGDYFIDHNTKAGLSFLTSESDYLKTSSAAAHFETSVGKGSSFLIELGQNKKTPIQGNQDISTLYLTSHIFLKASRGLFLTNGIEYLKLDSGDYQIRFAPGVQIFPTQRVELKLELWNTRLFSKNSNSDDSWSFLGQTHLWF